MSYFWGFGGDINFQQNALDSPIQVMSGSLSLSLLFSFAAVIMSATASPAAAMSDKSAAADNERSE